MTELIINGVDVSRCGYLLSPKEPECIIQGLGTNETINCCSCRDNPNCYYKQLKRKEQAIKELQQSLDEKHKFLLALNINTSFEFKRAQLWLAEGKRILEQNRDLQYELNEYKELVKEIKAIAAYERGCKGCKYESHDPEIKCMNFPIECDYAQLETILQRIEALTSESEVENER